MFFSLRRQYSMDIWWEREKDVLYTDARWLIFSPLLSYFIACHTSVFSIVRYICLYVSDWLIRKQKKTVSDWLMLLVRHFASEIVHGSAILFLSQCPKFTELFLLNSFWFFNSCYIMLIKAIFSNCVPKMEQTAWSGTRVFGNLEHF